MRHATCDMQHATWRITDGVASTTGVDLQMASRTEIKNLVHAGARQPGTPGKARPEDIRFERRIGRMAEWFLDECWRPESCLTHQREVGSLQGVPGEAWAAVTRGIVSLRRWTCFRIQAPGMRKWAMAMLGREWSKGDTDRSGIYWRSLKLRRTAAGVSFDMERRVHGLSTVRGGGRGLCRAVRYSVLYMRCSTCIRWPGWCRTNIVAVMVIGQVRTRMR